MPGFFGYISKNNTIPLKKIDVYEIIERDKDLIIEQEVINDSKFQGCFFRNTIRKFEADKTFTQNEKLFLVVDGVVLNKQELINKYSVENQDIFSLTERMLSSGDPSFFNEFRGQFSGLFFNKQNDTFKLFTNHIGDKEVFYYLDEQNDVFYFGTDFEILVKLLDKHADKRFKLNTNAAYSLITHSYTLCNDTLFEGIHRLTPGHYIEYSANGLEKHCYYELTNETVDISEEEALEQIDILFRQAIKRSFDKDIEYGYKHLVALSGGLDSRMTTWVASDMGYANMMNYTFSQTDYLDEKIPKKIVNELKNEWIFKSLDNGLYLYKYFEEAVRITGGRCQSSSITPTLSFANTINMDSFGIAHTGHLGDAVLGTYYEKGAKQKFKPGSGANSLKLIDKVHYTRENSFHIDDQEMFKIYNRGFTGIDMGLKPFHKYMEANSPFSDIDFMRFCLSMPFKFRKGHYIYIKWINKYYPKAADFVYEKINGKINKKLINVKGVSIPWTSLPSAAVKFLKIKLGLKLTSKNHMNPIDYWVKTNKELDRFYQERFYNNIDRVKNEELKNDCKYAFESGTAMEKDQVITFVEFLRSMSKYME